MSTMSETAIGMSELLTQGNKMIAAWREALNDLEALLYLIERASGQKSERIETEDDSIVPEDLIKEEAEPCRTATVEEIRPRMAALKAMGYREDMRGLIVKRGVTALTQITDPVDLSDLDAELDEFMREKGIELNMTETKS